MNQLVPIADAQSALGGISRTTIYRLVEEGRLQRVNIGRRSFITGDSIRNYLGSISQINRDKTLTVVAESGAAWEGDKPDMRPLIARDIDGRLYECRPIE